MQKCTIFHTGIYTSSHGIIIDNKVYLLDKDKKPCFVEEMFMAREECEGGLIQFEVEGKWGFADIYKGEIMINPVWDYVGPFYSGYAHVALGCQIDHDGYNILVTGGKHGYINTKGEIIIPLEYDDAINTPIDCKYFKVCKNKKWGMIDAQNKIMIPFLWNRLEINHKNDLIFCGKKQECEIDVNQEDRLKVTTLNIESEPSCYEILKWGVYDKEFKLIVEPELDEEPIRPKIKSNPRSRSYSYYEKYYILKRGKKYGLMYQDGRWVANIELSKKQAKNMINSICEGEFSGHLYI